MDICLLLKLWLKRLVKKMSKNLRSGKYSQKLLDRAKQYAIDASSTVQKEPFKK